MQIRTDIHYNKDEVRAILDSRDFIFEEIGGGGEEREEENRCKKEEEEEEEGKEE